MRLIVNDLAWPGFESGGRLSYFLGITGRCLLMSFATLYGSVVGLTFLFFHRYFSDGIHTPFFGAPSLRELWDITYRGSASYFRGIFRECHGPFSRSLQLPYGCLPAT